MLVLREAGVGSASSKLWMEPRRRGGAEPADENEDRRRRAFWGVNWRNEPNARANELCECSEPSSTHNGPSRTASSTPLASRTSLKLLANVCEAVRFMVCSRGACVWPPSSAAEEVFGRYDRIEGLRCIGGVGVEKSPAGRSAVSSHAAAAMRRRESCCGRRRNRNGRRVVAGSVRWA